MVLVPLQLKVHLKFSLYRNMTTQTILSKYYLQNLPRLEDHRVRQNIDRLIDKIISNNYAKGLVEAAKHGEDCYFCDFYNYVEMHLTYQEKNDLQRFFPLKDVLAKFVSKFPGCIVKNMEDGFLVDWS